MTRTNDREWWIPCGQCDGDGGRWGTEAEYRGYHREPDPLVDALAPPRPTFYVLDEAGRRVSLRDALAELGLISDGGK